MADASGVQRTFWFSKQAQKLGITSERALLLRSPLHGEMICSGTDSTPEVFVATWPPLARWISGEAVDLTKCKTDVLGLPVHELRYVNRTIENREQGSNPALRKHLWSLRWNHTISRISEKSGPTLIGAMEPHVLGARILLNPRFCSRRC